MECGRSQGCDGLPVEIYRALWDNIAKVLHKAVLYACEHGELHISARRGIISLIPKKSRDNTLLKNWRPLTLLNTDYRILAKTLAHRIKKLLP